MHQSKQASGLSAQVLIVWCLLFTKPGNTSSYGQEPARFEVMFRRGMCEVCFPGADLEGSPRCIVKGKRKTNLLRTGWGTGGQESAHVATLPPGSLSNNS